MSAFVVVADPKLSEFEFMQAAFGLSGRTVKVTAAVTQKKL